MKLINMEYIAHECAEIIWNLNGPFLSHNIYDEIMPSKSKTKNRATISRKDLQNPEMIEHIKSIKPFKKITAKTYEEFLKEMEAKRIALNDEKNWDLSASNKNP